MSYPSIVARLLPDGRWRGVYVRHANTEHFIADLAREIGSRGWDADRMLRDLVDRQKHHYVEFPRTTYESPAGPFEWPDGRLPFHETMWVYAVDGESGALTILGYVECDQHDDWYGAGEDKRAPYDRENRTPRWTGCKHGCLDYSGGFYRTWKTLGVWPLEEYASDPDRVCAEADAALEILNNEISPYRQP